MISAGGDYKTLVDELVDLPVIFFPAIVLEALADRRPCWPAVWISLPRNSSSPIRSSPRYS